MTPEQNVLYNRIMAFPLDDPDAAFPFSHKLAKENGWKLAYAHRAIAEYKRFAFLAMISPQPVSPSEQVDQVWHMHMTYTQSYWDEFCGKVLGKPFHHYPSKGGADESQKYVELYEATLALYEAAFGEKPPADIWSDSKTRFSDDLQVERVNTQEHWIIDKAAPWNIAISAVIVFGTAAAMYIISRLLTGMTDPFDLMGEDFLGLYVLLLIITCAIGAGLRWLYPARGSIAAVPLLTDMELAYLTGGTQRLADVALIRLLDNRSIVQEGSRFRTKDVLSSYAQPIEAAIYKAASHKNGATITRIRQVAAYPAEALHERLDKLGLMANSSENWVRAVLPRLLLFGLAVFGIVKIGVGISRGRPVAYLVILCAVTLGLALFVLGRKVERSQLADNIIAGIRAVQPKHYYYQELAMGVALYGAVALATSPSQELRAVLAPPSVSSGDGGGGGGGCGGGGCGGCGGCGG